MKGYEVPDVDPRFPDRPTHSDFFKLSEIVLEHDGDVEAGKKVEEIFSEAGVDLKSVDYMARNRCAVIAKSTTELNSLHAVWLDAFLAGVEFGKGSESEADRRIAAALETAHDGAYDGDHHKQWAIDQMIRNLTGCPTVTLQSKYPDAQGNAYSYEGLGESDEYKAWVAGHKNGEDGPDTYSWDEGIAP